MGLDVGIYIWLPNETSVDLDELREEVTARLMGRFKGTNRMFCLPFIAQEDREIYVFRLSRTRSE